MKGYFLLIGLLLLGGCATGKYDYGQEFTLKQGESITVGDAQFTFAGIQQDSRCPSDVQCFWQGEVIANVAIKQAGTTYTGNLTLIAGRNDKTKIGPFTASLIEVTPYPTSRKNTASSDYKAKFVVQDFS